MDLYIKASKSRHLPQAHTAASEEEKEKTASRSRSAIFDRVSVKRRIKPRSAERKRSAAMKQKAPAEADADCMRAWNHVIYIRRNRESSCFISKDRPSGLYHFEYMTLIKMVFSHLFSSGEISK